MERNLKNAVIAAGALAAATVAPAAPASAGDLDIVGAIAVFAAFAVAAHDPAPAAHVMPAHALPPQGFAPYSPGPRWSGAPAHRNRGPARGRPRAFPGRAPHAYAAPRPRWQPRCMERNDIKHMLAYQGWNGFGVDKIAGDIAVVYSSRGGVRYRIKLNRCTGQFIKVSEKGLF